MLSRAFNVYKRLLNAYPTCRKFSFAVMSKKKTVYYIYDKKLLDISKHIPNIGNRAVVVQSLIATYNLLSQCEICSCEEATDEDLLSFHSSDYLECLKKAQTSSDLERVADSEDIRDFNLGYDCPLFEGMYKFAALIAGSTLTAAKKLVSRRFLVKRTVHSKSLPSSQPRSYLKYKNGWKPASGPSAFEVPSDLSSEEYEEAEEPAEAARRPPSKVHQTEVVPLGPSELPICINWFGGWHHAQRDEAGGFCYVNDIVIAVQYLLKFYKRVLYIDLDVHHGNGVENAFLFSPRVLTFSIHKYEPGFYPTTGSVEDVGEGGGRFYTVNVPLKGGITDEKYVRVFGRVFGKVVERYRPECIVAQSGADCLAGDPLGGFNLTLEAVGACLRMVLEERVPTMVLGGGGYNVANTARCWAHLTSVVLECPISSDIPDNSFLHLYGPGFELGVPAGLRRDENSEDYLEGVVASVLRNLDNVSVA